MKPIVAPAVVEGVFSSLRAEAKNTGKFPARDGEVCVSKICDRGKVFARIFSLKPAWIFNSTEGSRIVRPPAGDGLLAANEGGVIARRVVVRRNNPGARSSD